jgi:hypothetical protein
MYGNRGPIEHIAEVGENVLLVEHGLYSLYQVAYIEPVPRSHPLVAEVTAGAGLLAGATIPAFNTTAVLDLNNGQLGQFRAHVLDDVHVTVLQAQSLTRFALMNVSATVNPFVHLEDEYDILTEFAIWEQRRVFLRVVNPTGYNLVQARVAFYGYKYVLGGPEGTSGGQAINPIDKYNSIKAAVESGHKFAVVPVGGWEL